jgi:hypothetical protein
MFIYVQYIKHFSKYEPIEKRERGFYVLFDTCFNRQAKVKKDLTLIKDTWDGTEMIKRYKIKLEL